MATQADDIILDATSGSSGGPREQHPVGQHIAVCVDAIDHGERVEEFAGKPRSIKRKISLVFMTGAVDSEGKPFEISKEFTFSSHEKAGLRKFLSQWTGVPLTDQEIKQGIRLSTYVGKPGILNLVAKPSKKGAVYTNIDTMTPLFAGLAVPALPAYTRSAFWEQRKQEYADGVAEYKRQEAVKAAQAAALAPQIAAPSAQAEQIQEAAANASVANAIAKEEAAQDAGLPPF